MLLVDINAIKAKITAAGGDFDTDLSRIISDNAMYDFNESTKSEFKWDDTSEILTVKQVNQDNRFGPDAMKVAPKYTVVFFAYAQIQRFEHKFIKSVRDALA